MRWVTVAICYCLLKNIHKTRDDWLLDYLAMSKLQRLYTVCPTLNGNKIKYYISEMKADIKLCST
jgi:hypothetical protein